MRRIPWEPTNGRMGLGVVVMRNAIVVSVAALALAAMFGVAGFVIGGRESARLRTESAGLNDSLLQLKRKVADLEGLARDSVRAYETEVALAEKQAEELNRCRGEVATATDKLRISEGELASLQKLLAFRSPRLSKAVRDFIQSAHKIEAVYSPNHENHFAVVMQAHGAFSRAVEDAIKNEGWPLADDGMRITDKARTPADALRAMADALRRYEAGEIGASEFIEAQADLLDVMEDTDSDQ